MVNTVRRLLQKMSLFGECFSEVNVNDCTPPGLAIRVILMLLYRRGNCTPKEQWLDTLRVWSKQYKSNSFIFSVFCMYICVYMHACLYVCGVYLCICMSMYVMCVPTCMHVHMYTLGIPSPPSKARMQADRHSYPALCEFWRVFRSLGCQTKTESGKGNIWSREKV